MPAQPCSPPFFITSVWRPISSVVGHAVSLFCFPPNSAIPHGNKHASLGWPSTLAVCSALLFADTWRICWRIFLATWRHFLMKSRNRSSRSSNLCFMFVLLLALYHAVFLSWGTVSCKLCLPMCMRDEGRSLHLSVCFFSGRKHENLLLAVR